MPKEILSLCVVQGRCSAKTERPRLHSHFNQNENGALCDLCSNLSESSYIRLQSAGCCHFYCSLNSQISFTFWFTLVHGWV